MHIPGYAHAMIRSALPAFPTARQVEALDCCLCDKAFEDQLPVPLGPTPESGLFGCRPCLTRLVARARRTRDKTLTQDAERVRSESAAWLRTRQRHLTQLDRVRKAAEAVAELVRNGDIEPLPVAWLLISLESAHAWLPEAPEPPASAEHEDAALRDGTFRLALAMISAREEVAERLAYHLINEAQPDESELCEEFGCPEDCSGRHDSSHIDAGPDAVFADLAEHGIVVERPEPISPSPRLAAFSASAEIEEKRPLLPDIEEQSSAILASCGIAADDVEVLLSAAAVGLVVDAWREGPLAVIHAADEGPNDGEIFAQSVDLYRRARSALLAARDDGPEGLLAFAAIASDVDLPWAGGSRFTLRTIAASTADFVQHVDDRVWFTTEVIRQRGWRTALLYRAVSAGLKAPFHFGMPSWPGTVASAMMRLAELDRSRAPSVLEDLAVVESALLEAPDRLGADALDWISSQAVFG